MKRCLTSFLVTLLLLASSQLSAQFKTVSGTITDLATKLPLEGINVNIKGTPTTVVTNAEGEFSITVPSAQSVLVVSYIGYGSVEKNVGTNENFTNSAGVDIKFFSGNR